MTCPVISSRHDRASSSHFQYVQPLGTSATARHSTPSTPSVVASERNEPNRCTIHADIGEAKSMTRLNVLRNAITHAGSPTIRIEGITDPSKIALDSIENVIPTNAHRNALLNTDNPRIPIPHEKTPTYPPQQRTHHFDGLQTGLQ